MYFYVHACRIFFFSLLSVSYIALLLKVRIARYLERFFPVVSVLTYFYVRCGTSAVKITLSNALSELLVKVRSVVN